MSKIPVLNHGVIGNGRVLALVSPGSSIDWLRFDSPSLFGRILDHDSGGLAPRFVSTMENYQRVLTRDGKVRAWS